MPPTFFDMVVFMVDFEFNTEELSDLEKDLTKAIRKCPIQAQETLKQLAKEFKNSAKKKANSELKQHNREGDQKKKAIRRKWGTEVVDEDVGMTALVWNSARHFHLVENGHNLVRGGRIVGFVPGKNIMEKTRNDYKDIVPERFEKMVDDILKECDLD